MSLIVIQFIPSCHDTHRQYFCYKILPCWWTLHNYTLFKMINSKHFNALDLAQPTNFNAMLKSGNLLWGTSCRIASEDVARNLAVLPHQFCFIDAVSTLNTRLINDLQICLQDFLR